MNSTFELDKTYVAPTYNRFPVEIASGKGSLIYDINGKEYIDMGSGIGVTAFGLADDEWINAVEKQIRLVQHTSNLYYTAPSANLAKVLCQKTGLKKVFFSNSGAEANECAIKAARKYAAEKKGADYNIIVTLEGSFHGRTLTTLAATGQAHYHELFNPLTPGFVHTPINNVKALEETLKNNKVAAIMLECVQGEGGVITLEADFINAINNLAKENDVIIIVDEVQTGNGRTGKMYAYMNFSITPDIVTTAKGLGGGLPIGATIFGPKCQNILGFGDHGSTYGGNPVACAAALSVVNRINESLLAEVTQKSNYIFNQLKDAKGVKSLSGMGLMVGIEPTANASDIVKKCMERGVLCLTAKNKVRLLPALNIGWSQLEKAILIIKEVLGESI